MMLSVQPMRRAARLVGLGLALLVAASLAGAFTRPAHAAAPSVTQFYVTTAAEYPWNGPGNPPPTTTFASGTMDIAFYWIYQDAVLGEGGTTFQIIVHELAPSASPSSQVITNTAYTAGSWTVLWGAFRPSAYPDAAYRADLLMDGQVAASTNFTVGAPAG